MMEEPRKSDGDGGPDRAWDSGWEEHEVAQLKRMAAIPFSKKVEWLEAAHRRVLLMQKEREAKGLGTIRSVSGRHPQTQRGWYIR